MLILTMIRADHIRACFAALLLCLVGCAPTQVRVLNLDTGQPVAGATLIPYVRELLGGGLEMPEVVTGNDGRATIPFPTQGALENVFVNLPLRQVYPDGQPRVEHGEMLLYVGALPRVELVVPHGYSGPIPLKLGELRLNQVGGRVYRIVVANHALQAVQIPLDDVESVLLEVERDGVVFKQGGDQTDSTEEAVWRRSTGTHKDVVGGWDASAPVLYIGTPAEFHAFEEALRQTTRPLDWQTLMDLQAGVVASGRAGTKN